MTQREKEISYTERDGCRQSGRKDKAPGDCGLGSYQLPDSVTDTDDADLAGADTDSITYKTNSQKSVLQTEAAIWMNRFFLMSIVYTD